MKKYIFIMLALAFMACEKTFYVGGTVTDMVSGDSIEGIEMGLFEIKTTNFKFTDSKWSDLELIATAITNNDGFFSVELESGFSMQSTIFLPLLPTDTLSVNTQYTPKFSDGLIYPQYGTNGDFKLKRSSHIVFHLVNFTQERIAVHCGDRSAVNPSLTYSPYLSFTELSTGQKLKFDLYEVINSNYDTRYLGSTSKYIKTQLPDEPEKVNWEMSTLEIEIDYNSLEK